MPFRDSWRELRGLPRLMWLIFAATLVNRMGTMVLPFLVLYLTRGLDMSAARAGVVLAVWGGSSLVSAPVLGKLSDRLGPMRMMQASLALTGVLLVAYPMAHGYPAVLALTVAVAVANEAFRPASMAVVADLVPPERLKPAFAVSRLAVNLGMGIGPAVGGWIADRRIEALFWADGGTSLLAAAILILGARGATHAGGGPARGARTGGPSVLADPRIRTCLLASLPVAVVFFQHMSAMPLFMVRDLGLPATTYGLMFTCNTALIVLLEVPLNTAAARWPHRITLTIGALLVAVGFGGMAWVGSLGGVLVTVILWTLGEALILPGLAAYVAEAAPDARRGEAMGYYTMTWSLAFTFGPWLGAVGLERLGPARFWSAILIVGLGAAALTTRLRADSAGA